MRKINLRFFFLFMAGLALNHAFAQADINSMGFNYSALVRDTAGRVQPNKNVQLRFTVLSSQTGTSNGSPYIEEDSVFTDAYGFANVTIGQGKQTGGSAKNFASVDFSAANYWLLIQVYNTFTKSWDALAKQALQAVPYAKVAYTSIYGGVPPGTIVAFGGEKIPDGWELCDGGVRNQYDPKYVNLYNAIKTAWGSPGTGLFNIPQTSGLFLRGASHGPAYDPERGIRRPIQPGAANGDACGSYQDDAFASHYHYEFSCTYCYPISNPNNDCCKDPDAAPALQSLTGKSEAYNIGTSGQSSTRNATVGASSKTGGSETRPKNVYVNYIIKL